MKSKYDKENKYSRYATINSKNTPKAKIINIDLSQKNKYYSFNPKLNIINNNYSQSNLKTFNASLIDNKNNHNINDISTKNNNNTRNRKCFAKINDKLNYKNIFYNEIENIDQVLEPNIDIIKYKTNNLSDNKKITIVKKSTGQVEVINLSKSKLKNNNIDYTNKNKNQYINNSTCAKNFKNIHENLNVSCISSYRPYNVISTSYRTSAKYTNRYSNKELDNINSGYNSNVLASTNKVLSNIKNIYSESYYSTDNNCNKKQRIYKNNLNTYSNSFINKNYNNNQYIKNKHHNKILNNYNTYNNYSNNENINSCKNLNINSNNSLSVNNNSICTDKIHSDCNIRTNNKNYYNHEYSTIDINNKCQMKFMNTISRKNVKTNISNYKDINNTDTIEFAKSIRLMKSFQQNTIATDSKSILNTKDNVSTNIKDTLEHYSTEKLNDLTIENKYKLINTDINNNNNNNNKVIVKTNSRKTKTTNILKEQKNEQSSSLKFNNLDNRIDEINNEITTPNFKSHNNRVSNISNVNIINRSNKINTNNSNVYSNNINKNQNKSNAKFSYKKKFLSPNFDYRTQSFNKLIDVEKENLDTLDYPVCKTNFINKKLDFNDYNNMILEDKHNKYKSNNNNNNYLHKKDYLDYSSSSKINNNIKYKIKENYNSSNNINSAVYDTLKSDSNIIFKKYNKKQNNYNNVNKCNKVINANNHTYNKYYYHTDDGGIVDLDFLRKSTLNYYTITNYIKRDLTNIKKLNFLQTYVKVYLKKINYKNNIVKIILIQSFIRGHILRMNLSNKLNYIYYLSNLIFTIKNVINRNIINKLYLYFLSNFENKSTNIVYSKNNYNLINKKDKNLLIIIRSFTTFAISIYKIFIYNNLKCKHIFIYLLKQINLKDHKIKSKETEIILNNEINDSNINNLIREENKNYNTNNTLIQINQNLDNYSLHSKICNDITKYEYTKDQKFNKLECVNSMIIDKCSNIIPFEQSKCDNIYDKNKQYLVLYKKCVEILLSIFEKYLINTIKKNKKVLFFKQLYSKCYIRSNKDEDKKIYYSETKLNYVNSHVIVHDANCKAKSVIDGNSISNSHKIYTSNINTKRKSSNISKNSINYSYLSKPSNAIRKKSSSIILSTKFIDHKDIIENNNYNLKSSLERNISIAKNLIYNKSTNIDKCELNKYKNSNSKYSCLFASLYNINKEVLIKTFLSNLFIKIEFKDIFNRKKLFYHWKNLNILDKKPYLKNTLLKYKEKKSRLIDASYLTEITNRSVITPIEEHIQDNINSEISNEYKQTANILFTPDKNSNYLVNNNVNENKYSSDFNLNTNKINVFTNLADNNRKRIVFKSDKSDCNNKQSKAFISTKSIQFINKLNFSKIGKQFNKPIRHSTLSNVISSCFEFDSLFNKNTLSNKIDNNKTKNLSKEFIKRLSIKSRVNILVRLMYLLYLKKTIVKVIINYVFLKEEFRQSNILSTKSLYYIKSKVNNNNNNTELSKSYNLYEDDDVDDLYLSYVLLIQQFYRNHLNKKFIVHYAYKLKTLSKIERKFYNKKHNLLKLKFIKWKRSFITLHLKMNVLLIENFYIKSKNIKINAVKNKINKSLKSLFSDYLLYKHIKVFFNNLLITYSKNLDIK